MPRAVDERQRRERDEVRAGALREGVDGEPSQAEAVHFVSSRAARPESRRSRRHACRALCHAFVGVGAACRARFCCLLPPGGFLPLSARDGARFAAGFARRCCGLPSLSFCEFQVRLQRFDSGRTVKSGNSRAKSRKTGFPIERFTNPKFRSSSFPRAGRHRSPLEKHPWPHALTRVPLVV